MSAVGVRKGQNTVQYGAIGGNFRPCFEQIGHFLLVLQTFYREKGIFLIFLLVAGFCRKSMILLKMPYLTSFSLIFHEIFFETPNT